MTDILDLEGWRVTGQRLELGEYVIEADYTVPPPACLKCGVIGHLYKHGPKPIYIRDSPIRGHAVSILANAQRYKCRECGGTFIQPLGGVQPAMRMTERCVRYIEEQCLRDTFVRISEHVGCDDKTVRTVAHSYIERLNTEYRPYLPEWLGIDETQIDGKLRCVFADVGNRRPIDMLPDRDKGSVTTWLHSFRNRSVVKGLAIDMWRPYKDAAQSVFPGLPVVIDKFHVVRMANNGLEKVRIRLAKTKDKKVGRDWMRRKSLLRLRESSLDEKQRFNLSMWLDNEPEIETAYRVKEGFYGIYDSLTRATAANALHAWRKSVPSAIRADFKELLTASKNWEEEILAYFDHPISNGYTEALNGVAKVINRSGRGYSFEVLRARLLFKDRPKAEVIQPGTGFARAYPPAALEGHRMLVDSIGHRCESCLGIFDQLEAHRPPLLASEKAMDVMYVCHDCYRRFHTKALTHGLEGST